MKTHRLLLLTCITSLFLVSCASYAPYAYDDLYYSPSNDPVKQVQKNPKEDFNKTDNIYYDGSYKNRYSEEEKDANAPQSLYQNRYTQAEQQENSQLNNESSSYQEQEEVYYDEDYAQTLQQLNSPVRSFNTYDSYQRDRILYTHDPFFCTPVLYSNYTFWDPFVPRTGLSVGWNSWSGWNVGLGIGWGVPAPIYNPWNPYRNLAWNRWNGWYDPFFYPYSSFGFWNNPYDPWLYGGFGYSPYWAGYNNGFYNGYYHGNRDLGTGGNSNRRYYTTPRGEKGSSGYTNTGGSNRPNRPTTNGKSLNNKSLEQNTNNPETMGRPNRPTQPTIQQSNPKSVEERPTATPRKYQTTTTPESYSRPERMSRPTNTTTPRSNVSSEPRPTQSRPSYSRPRQENTYNQPSRTQPQQYESAPQQTRPQTQPQQARPQRQSRPTYNRSTPTYTPPRSSGGGGSSRSVPSRPTSPARR